MFVKNNDLIEIKIYYKQNKHKFLALTSVDVNTRIKAKKMSEEQVKEFNLLTVNMQQLTWGAYNELQNIASKISNNGDKYFDYKTYKEERLKRLIKTWDAKDEKGNIIPVNEANIMSLVPVIGDTIVKAYDEENYYDEETEKK